MATSHYGAVLRAIETGNQPEAKRLLDEANEQYYGGGDSPLTDAEFDEAQAAYLGRFGIQLKTRQAKARTDRHAGSKQDFPLLANWLAKAQTKAELGAWLAERMTPEDIAIGSPKYDGMSLVFTYDGDGTVKRVLTRGDDGMGVDVTRMFQGESHWNALPAEVAPFGVKYEVVMRWADLEALNEATGEAYKNPRNTVAGIVGADDSRSRRRYVTLAPLDAEWEGMPEDRIERLEILDQLITGGHFFGNIIGDGDDEVVLPTPWEWVVGTEHENMLEFYDQLVQRRLSAENEYMIDGVVIELGNADAIERNGGRVSDCPAYSMAAKFPHIVARTSAVSMDWDLGNTGRLTPVVNFEPVVLNGNTYSRTSIANMTRFDKLRLGPGSPLVFELRNDVLGWLDRGGEDPAGTVPFPEPINCTFTYNEKGERVFAYVDAPLDGRCERMMVKCGVKGVRIEPVFKLVEAGVVTSLADMWTLQERHASICSLPGFGEASADLICSAIETKLRLGLWDWEILASVGINGVGRTLAREALKVMTLDDMLDLGTDQISPPDRSVVMSNLHAAIGPERSRIVLDGVAAHEADLRALKEIALTRSTYHVTQEARSAYNGPFYKVVVTGDLERWERDEFKTLIEGMGHKMVGSISSKTDYLITNTPNSGTVKNRKAQELGVPIVTEEQAIEVLGIVVEATPAAAVQEQPEMTAADLANFNL